jgi:hypothetical protein
MAKLNLYVPDDLKAQMDEVGDSVNWSEVARPAFQAAVANLRHRKDRNMSTAIERLRASKAQSVQNDQMLGTKHGREWAENRASYDELVRVSKIEYDDEPRENINPSYYVIKAIDPHKDLAPGEVLDNLFGEHDGLSDEYLFAWVEGAQEFFGEVQDQL